MVRNPDGSIHIPCRKKVRILDGHHFMSCSLEKGHTGKHEHSRIQWEDGDDFTTCERIETIDFLPGGQVRIRKYGPVQGR